GAPWIVTTPPINTNGTVTFSNPIFPHGASASFTITVKVAPGTPTPSTVSNTASAASASSTTVVSNPATAALVVSPTVDLFGNTFFITRDATGQFIQFTTDGVVYSQLASTVQTINLHGNPGNDSVTIDNSNGLITNQPNPSPPVVAPLPINYF